MELQLLNHPYRYECENLCRLFFPYNPVQVVESLSGGKEPWALAAVEECSGGCRVLVRASDGERQWKRRGRRKPLRNML